MKFKNLIQTNYDIFDICKKIDLPLVDVCMRDNFNKDFNNNENYIVNLDSKENQGTHFCGLCIKNNAGFYCDSYGFPPCEEIRNIFKKRKMKLYYNDKHIQHLNSSSCAYWSIAFLLWMNKVLNKTSLLNHFQNYINLFNSDNQIENEKILKDFLKPF